MPVPATKPKPRIASELIAIGAMFFLVSAEWLVMVGAGVAVALTKPAEFPIQCEALGGDG